MSKTLRILITILIITMACPAGAQRFFNLTAEEIAIDSILPSVGCDMVLPMNHGDSVYRAEILYPEFIDMAPDDIQRYNSLTGSRPLSSLPEVGMSIVTARRQPKMLFSVTPLVWREGRYQFLVSFMLKVTSQPAAHMARRAATTANGVVTGTTRAQGDRYAAHSVLAKGRWAKIRVSKTGFYRLTEDVIRRAGFTDLSRVHIYGYGGNLVPEKLTADYIIEHDDLMPVESAIINGKRVFHARGPVSWESSNQTTRTRNPYSDHGYYFITQMENAADTVSADQLKRHWLTDHSRFYSLYEDDSFAWYHGGRNLVDGRSIDPTTAKPYTFKLNAPDQAQLDKGGTLTVVMTSDLNGAFSVKMNGSKLGTGNLSMGTYAAACTASYTFKVDSLKAENEIEILALNGSKQRLDYAMLRANSVSDSLSLDSIAFPQAEYVHNITTQDHHADEAVDLTIIIPTSQRLREQAERLKAHHEEHDQMTVRIVPADELYNEFSSGTPDVSAYRRYMKMMYDRAGSEAEMPKHVLLFGKCVWDNRLRTSDCKKLNADDLLLCYESENSVSKTDCFVAEDFIALLDDEEELFTKRTAYDCQYLGIPDVGIGRIPVTSDMTAATVVDKIIAYAKNRNIGSWQNTLMFMGDDGDNNMHMKAANTTADEISSKYPGYNIRKVMWDDYKIIKSSTGNRYPECTDIIKKQQNTGALLMDYCGHGRADALAHELVLTLQDFQKFNNTNLPVWVTASCDTAPYDGVADNIGETVLLGGKGGGIAFYGTTRTVYANYNEAINKEFIRTLLSTTADGRRMTLGEANRRAKENLVTKGTDRTCNKLQYNLLGDPALAINTPQLKCVVESINGKPVAETPALSANSKVCIEGHIEMNGTRSTDFNGLISAVVKDNMELRTCQNNLDEADIPFTYHDRSNTLFAGTDSVRNGRFAINFVMPRDINYSDDNGLITLFAYNPANNTTAHGETSDFTVGGSEEVFNDSIGPSVFCYLNTPSFNNGDNVNNYPFFVAEIRDNDGINASGAGIGHNMQLIIDNDADLTFSLNENFQFDFGSYTSGSTFYCIPKLKAGHHTLQFRAWDILNNPTTTTLAFNVVNGLDHNITDINVTKNPARTSTTFVIQHDRPGAVLDTTIEIMDMSGRLLHTIPHHSEQGSAVTTVDWDITTDGGGRLQTGVYLYRVHSVCDGNIFVSKAKKLIIMQ